MIQFDIGLLSRRVRGTIEEMNVAALNFLWIGEFSAVIGQKNSEYERKALAKLFSVPIETGNDGSGGIGLPLKSKHEITGGQVQGEQHLSADFSDNAVNLNDGILGMLRAKALKILKRAAISASFIDFHAALFRGTGLHAAGMRHINASGLQGAGVNQPVKRSL